MLCRPNAASITAVHWPRCLAAATHGSSKYDALWRRICFSARSSTGNKRGVNAGTFFSVHCRPNTAVSSAKAMLFRQRKCKGGHNPSLASNPAAGKHKMVCQQCMEDWGPDQFMPCRLDTATSDAEPQLFRQTKLKGGYTPSQEFETKQVFAASKDGTKIPIFITHKKGTPLNGSAPTLLYGYGGNNASRLCTHKPNSHVKPDSVNTVWNSPCHTLPPLSWSSTLTLRSLPLLDIMMRFAVVVTYCFAKLTE